MSNRKRVRKVKCILFSFVTSFSVVIFLEECISYTKFLPVVFNEVDKKWMLWIERTLQTFLGLFCNLRKYFLYMVSYKHILNQNIHKRDIYLTVLIKIIFMQKSKFLWTVFIYGIKKKILLNFNDFKNVLGRTTMYPLYD